MRDYLFRGKRRDNSEWTQGFYIKDAIETYIYDKYAKRRMQSVVPETVGEYTGLTDKNGKKIFEGDIVICIYDGTEHTYQIIWDISELDFKAAINKENYGKCFEYLPCCDEIEVIGNIHDNPELLTEESNG